MRPPSPPRRSAIAAIALLLLTGAGVGHALAARGGLSVFPGILEGTARPGSVGALKISNTAPRPMKVRLAVHPWIQSPGGSVYPDRRRVLGKLRPNRRAFWLGAGATKTLGLSLAARPARGSLYGAIEVTGAPRYRGGKGIKVAYRLVTSLRLYPPAAARVFRPSPQRLFQYGTTRRGALFLAVKNAGNTIDPIGATVTIKGHGLTLRNEVSPKTILPGATVNLRLTRLRGTLPRGRYSVAVRLTQNGRAVGGFKRGVRLR